jgi:hypothetical protein
MEERKLFLGILYKGEEEVSSAIIYPPRGYLEMGVELLNTAYYQAVKAVALYRDNFGRNFRHMSFPANLCRC